MTALRSESNVTFDDDVCVLIGLVLDHVGDENPNVMISIHGHGDDESGGNHKHTYGTAIIAPPAVVQRLALTIISSLKKVGKYDPLLTADLPEPPKDIQRN